MTINGNNIPEFDAVAEQLARQLAEHSDLGSAVSVIRGDDTLVDLWGGHTDLERNTSWAEDTLVHVWSVTKPMTALAMLHLLDAHDMSPDDTVATYWSEFGCNGKEKTTIADLMGHTSGVAAWADPITLDETYDTSTAAALLAAQTPWFSPGTSSAYAAICYGHLLGEIIYRVSGATLGEYFATHIAQPGNLDFFIGVPTEEQHRISPLQMSRVVAGERRGETDNNPHDTLRLPGKTEAALRNPYITFADTQQSDYRRAELGGFNGHGTARAISRAMRIFDGGQLDGVRFFSPELADRVFVERSNVKDEVLKQQMRLGMGLGLSNDVVAIPGDNVGWWAGYGGAFTFIRRDDGLAFTYVTNTMSDSLTGDDRLINLLFATFAGLTSYEQNDKSSAFQ